MTRYRLRFASDKKPIEVSLECAPPLFKGVQNQLQPNSLNHTTLPCHPWNPAHGLGGLGRPESSRTPSIAVGTGDHGSSKKTPILVAALILGLVKLYALWGAMPFAIESVEYNDAVPDMQMDTNGIVVKGLVE